MTRTAYHHRVIRRSRTCEVQVSYVAKWSVVPWNMCQARFAENDLANYSSALSGQPWASLQAEASWLFA